jgi:hypothetical protein
MPRSRKIGLQPEHFVNWVRTVEDRFNEMMGDHASWEFSKRVIENDDEGARHLSLANSVARHINARLTDDHPSVTVEPEHPKGWAYASKASVAVRNAYNISGLWPAIQRAQITSMWAPFSCIRVFSTDDQTTIHHKMISPRQFPAQEIKENLVEVEEDENVGFNLEEIPELDTEFQKEGRPTVITKTKATPWVEEIDPRLIVVPKHSKNGLDADWVAQIHLLTKEEVMAHFRVSSEQAKSIEDAKYTDLFMKATLGTSGNNTSWTINPVCVVELFVFRDRVAPRDHPYKIIFVMNRTEIEPFSIEFIPVGGIVPFVFMTCDPLRHVNSKMTLARDLIKVSSAYHDAFEGLCTRISQSRSTKVLVSPNTFSSPEDKKNFNNPSYSGTISVNNPESIKLWQTSGADSQHVNLLTSLRSMVNTHNRVSANDVAAGQQGMTATQTRIIMDASGINISHIKGELGRVVSTTVMIIMHFYSVLGLGTDDDEFQIGSEWIITTPIAPSSNPGLRVVVHDSDEQVRAEERVVINQLLNVVLKDPTGLIRNSINMHQLIDRLLASYGMDPAKAMKQEAFLPQAGISPFQGQGATPEGPDPLETMGQHPERDLGSRGTEQSAPNALAGASRTGMTR